MTKTLDLATLHTAVNGSAAAFRCRRKLQPAGGPGDKVFPPTFAGAVYAVEQRRVFDEDGKPLPEPKTCVVLDTVQSQANRMEQALQDALDHPDESKRIKIPVLKVDFSPWSPAGSKPEGERLIDDVGVITSLQVPHRLADAILRDSQTADGVKFRDSEKGKALNTVSQQNATALYQLCPTALIFGMWDSTGPKGGLGAKFERAMVSEVVGFGATFGLKTASRIDPLITKTEGIEVYLGTDGSWTLDASAAKKDSNGKPISLGKGQKKGKVSNANLGNVTPSFAEYGDGVGMPDPLKVQQLTNANYNLLLDSPDALKKLEVGKAQIAAGGASIEYAEQLTTLSLIVLRRLRFPANGISSPEADAAGRTVLAALGLCAAALAFEAGMGLRSRCLLWPDAEMKWEILAKPGAKTEELSHSADEAIRLLADAVAAANNAGLKWEESGIPLTPQQKLVDLVRLSQLEATKEEGNAD
jgi:CRISPR-associated protein Csb1